MKTGAGHVSYRPTQETQYIGPIKSGYLIGKPLFSPGISCNKTVIVPDGTTRPPFSNQGRSETPGFSLQESCPLARQTETPEWLPRVKVVVRSNHTGVNKPLAIIPSVISIENICLTRMIKLYVDILKILHPFQWQLRSSTFAPFKMMFAKNYITILPVATKLNVTREATISRAGSSIQSTTTGWFCIMLRNIRTILIQYISPLIVIKKIKKSLLLFMLYTKAFVVVGSFISTSAIAYAGFHPSAIVR